MKTNNSTKSTPSNTPTQSHHKELEFKRKVKTEGFQNFKAFDEFIQSSLDKFKFVDPMQELYDATGNDANTIISHKSTIPDLVIWNKTFNKNECFEGADIENKNPFPRFQFYLRVKTNKSNDKVDKKKKEKKLSGKENELLKRESSQEIGSVAMLNVDMNKSKEGKDKKREMKAKVQMKKEDIFSKGSGDIGNGSKMKQPKNLRDLLEGEMKQSSKQNEVKLIINENANNENNDNSINSGSLSNSPFDDIEHENKMFGQVLSDKQNDMNAKLVNANVNKMHSGNDVLNTNNLQTRTNVTNQQNKNFFEQEFNFNNILGDDIKPSKTVPQDTNTFDFDIHNLKDEENEISSPIINKQQSHLQNMNMLMDSNDKEIHHPQQSYFNNEFNNINANEHMNPPSQSMGNVLNQLKDNNIMNENNAPRNEYENMLFKMSNPSSTPSQLPHMNQGNRIMNTANPNIMEPPHNVFEVQNNSNINNIQFHMQDQIDNNNFYLLKETKEQQHIQQQLQLQQQFQPQQQPHNNFLQSMAGLNISEQKQIKKKQKKPKQPPQFTPPNINSFDNEMSPFQQPSSPFPMQQPHLQQPPFPHEQNNFMPNINSPPNQYQQQLLMQQQQQQQQQQQRQTEFLLNIVANNFDRKGWILLGDIGRMFDGFTSYELFQFLKEKVNVADISVLVIADRERRLMLRGDQIFYVLSHTLPVIIQYKQKQLVMFGLQNQNAMNVNVNANMGMPSMTNSFNPQIQGMPMQMQNMNMGMNMNMNMNMNNPKKQRKNKK